MADAKSPAPAPATLHTRFSSFNGDTPTLTDVEHALPRAGSSGPPNVDLATADPTLQDDERYERRALLGRGGMGEVQLCRDRRIGREVAVKLALPATAASAEGRTRFLREARVQGQLEHPAIVPVHDLEILADGSAYFTMKRVRGMTLAEVLERKRAGDPDIERRFTSRKLLQAFVSVCLAVDFAHARGVLHRDLKPTNIMLGDFGEVYVLDWGLAKIIGDDDDDASLTDAPVDVEGLHTEHGVVLGTPGYLAPEQLDQGLGAVGPTVDVYALGAILFEILAEQPLLPPMGRMGLLVATVQGVVGRPSERAPAAKVPPALDDVCARALARIPDDRFASARALSEAVDRVLEGDADRTRRKELAEEHLRRADAALARAADAGDDDASTRSMREVTHAFALDPDNERARRLMLRLLTSIPEVAPAEVRARSDAIDAELMRAVAAMNAWTVFAWLVLLPYAWWMGVRDWTGVALILVPLVLHSMTSFVMGKQKHPHVVLQALGILLILFAYVAASRGFGPFMMVPALLASFAVAMQAHPWKAARVASVVGACATLLVSIGLEWTALVTPSYTFEGGRMIVTPSILEFSETAVFVLFVAASIATIILPAIIISRVRDALNAAQLKLLTQAWHLERILPEQPAPPPRAIVADDDRAE